MTVFDYQHLRCTGFEVSHRMCAVVLELVVLSGETQPKKLEKLEKKACYDLMLLERALLRLTYL
jgi:hypothetical protein